MWKWTRVMKTVKNLLSGKSSEEKCAEESLSGDSADPDVVNFIRNVRNHVKVEYPTRDFGVTYRKSSISAMRKKVKPVNLPGSDIPQGRRHRESCGTCGSFLIWETGHDILCLRSHVVGKRATHNKSIIKPIIRRELPVCPTDVYREAFYRRVTAIVPRNQIEPMDYDNQSRKRPNEDPVIIPWPGYPSGELLPCKFARFGISSELARTLLDGKQSTSNDSCPKSCCNYRR